MRGAVAWLCEEAPGDRCVDVPRILIEGARCVELSGHASAARAMEPAYHNRLHVADTLVSMAGLLRARRRLQGVTAADLSHFEMICLFTMTVHDFDHAGRCNRRPTEIERRSLARFAPHARRIGMAKADWALVRQLVLSTDPQGVAEVHKAFLDNASAKDSPTTGASATALATGASPMLAEMAVLVTEADVLASALEFPGVELTRSLAQEWRQPHPEMARNLLGAQGRIRFLSTGARFSSGAANALGVARSIREHLDYLEHHGMPSVGDTGTAPPVAAGSRRGSRIHIT
jgi:hypothetical protein